MKGIIILGFNENSEAYIDTQFPSNICEFLNVTPKILLNLTEEHMKRKMEPNFLNMIITEDVSVASFYTGFSFRHYVGKPDFSVTVFLSDDDTLSNEFEGMLRRIAHELLPKREALNFDDILGKYYDMLKNVELSPFWEEIIEGETKLVEIKDNAISEEDADQSSRESKISDSNQEGEDEDLKKKNLELEELLEEKKGKIRELTNKYTELVTDKKNAEDQIQAFKNEVSEQYIKLEKWSQQMADLNENNAKLIEEIKDITNKLTKKEGELEIREKEIEGLRKNLSGADDIEKEAEKLLQEIEDLKRINLGLNNAIEKSEKAKKELQVQVDRIKNGSMVHIDSITNLKLEIKDFKSKFDIEQKEKEKLKDDILDMKKELKIIRRERDHYKKIVKENNLL